MAPAALVAGVLALGGCSEVRQAVGLEKTSPDEFQVRVRKPLSMPREFGKLAPPQPGAQRPQAETSSQRAKQHILDSVGNRRTSTRIAGVSRAESTLIGKLGGEKVDADIRRKINRESDLIAESNRSIVDSILFWKDEKKPGKVVDAGKETKRLQENVALGKAPDAGKTPIIERKEKGLFSSSIFADWF